MGGICWVVGGGITETGVLENERNSPDSGREGISAGEISLNRGIELWNCPVSVLTQCKS